MEKEMPEQLPALSYWDTHNEDYAKTLGGVDAITRKMVREHIIASGYKSALEFGCGLGWDAEPMLAAGISWNGVESCRKFRMEVAMRLLSFQEDPPDYGRMNTIYSRLPDTTGSHDVVYCRHVLEHLPELRPTLESMVKLARREVILTLAEMPGRETRKSFDDERGLHWNVWGWDDYLAICPNATLTLIGTKQGKSGQAEVIVRIKKESR